MMHGLEFDAAGKPICFRFGIFRLLDRLFLTKDDEALRDWVERFRSGPFRHHISHWQQCFLKFDRAAGHVARCNDAMSSVLDRLGERVRSGQSGLGLSPEWLEMEQISIEIPIFLDSMFIYLRLQADTYAELVTFFYRGRDTGKISSHSFRSQFKWFTRTEPDFDVPYREILLANSGWFELLAGENPKGLRDVIIHGGIMQTSWRKSREGPAKPQIALYRSSGVREEDLYERLKEITRGWFLFLDAALYHFMSRLNKDGLSGGMTEQDGEHRWFDESQLRGFWVYPKV
jgi:hypothetical protein